MTRQRKRQREQTPVDQWGHVDVPRQLMLRHQSEAAAHQRARAEQWSREHPDGEGLMYPDNYGGAVEQRDPGDLAQWVRVYDRTPERGDARAVATFYVYSRGGEPVGLSLVPPTKGAAPNPYVGVQRCSVHADRGDGDDSGYPPGVSQAVGTAARPRRSGGGESRYTPGARGRLAVWVVPDIDSGEDRVQFPRFKVRASLLMRALARFREAGEQRVSVDVLQQAIGRL